MKISLSRQLLSGFGISLVVVGFSTLWINYRLLQNDLEKQVQNRAQSIARSIEFATEGILEYGNTSILQRMVQNYATLPTVIEVAIVAPDGTTIANQDVEVNQINYGLLHPELIPYLESASNSGLEVMLVSTIKGKTAIIQILPFSSNIFGQSGLHGLNKRGLAITAIDLQQVQQEAWGTFVTTTVTMLLGTLAILILMVLLIQIYALRPLKKLNSAIARSKTTGTVTLPESLPCNEIGYLAQTLVMAIAQLQEVEHSKNEELRRINVELEELSESLEQKVIERTSELTSANIELKHAKEVAQEASKAKSSFLANMSHELRTPLNAILGFTQLIIEEKRVDSDVESQLKIINNSGEHLLSLINGILAMSKIESGTHSLNINSFRLNNLIVTVREIMEFKVSTKNLSLKFYNNTHIDKFIETDELKLRQVLINLLSNAIKFTESGSIILRIFEQVIPSSPSENRSDERYLSFEVEDTGIGIPPEDLGRIFDAFFQSESSSQLYEGTGLGLAISNQFVKLLGGKISVTSILNQGSIFRFSIPVKLVDNEFVDTDEHAIADMSEIKSYPNLQKTLIEIEDKNESEDLKSLTKLRILIAEDNIINQKITLRMLERLDCKADIANDGTEVLSKLESSSYDLILMDIQMPNMDGIEATKHIYHPDFAYASDRPLIVAVTASAMPEDRERCIAAGMYDYISKPIKIDTLRDVLSKVSHGLSNKK